MRHTHLLIATLALLLLPSCESRKTSQFSDDNSARASFQKISDVADVIFWHATDKCLRENSDGLKQMTTLEKFAAEHECEITELKQVNKTYVATVKIHNPSFTTAWYELTYEEAGNGWQAIDGKLISDGHEMNYFEGHFLSATNLKPYVDEATAAKVK